MWIDGACIYQCYTYKTSVCLDTGSGHSYALSRFIYFYVLLQNLHVDSPLCSKRVELVIGYITRLDCIWIWLKRLQNGKWSMEEKRAKAINGCAYNIYLYIYVYISAQPMTYNINEFNIKCNGNSMDFGQLAIKRALYETIWWWKPYEYIYYIFAFNIFHCAHFDSIIIVRRCNVPSRSAHLLICRQNGLSGLNGDLKSLAQQADQYLSFPLNGTRNANISINEI